MLTHHPNNCKMTKQYKRDTLESKKVHQMTDVQRDQ